MGDDVLREIGDEELEEIAGGYIFYALGHNDWFSNEQWELLDKKGNVIGRFRSRDNAVKAAKDFGYSTKELDWVPIGAKSADRAMSSRLVTGHI